MKKLDLNNPIIKYDMEELYSSNIEWNQMNKKNILISGATGMLASYLVLFFIYLNEIHNFEINLYLNVRSSEKARTRFGEYLSRKNIFLVTGDIVNGINIQNNIHYIIHAASLASPQYYKTMPVETALPNIVGTYNLLEFAKEQQEFMGFLFFSSGSVYGNTKQLDSITELDVGSLDFLNNGNSYAESKRCGEMLCHAYWSEYNLPVKSVRIHHTYAPTMDYENDKRVFSEFIRNCIEGKDIILKSDGTAKRSFCYITDMISGMLFVLFYGVNGESYNLGNPNCFISIYELAKIIANDISRTKLSIVREPRKETQYQPSPESDTRMVPVNIEKAKMLGWIPKISCSEGFLRVVEFYSCESKENGG